VLGAQRWVRVELTVQCWVCVGPDVERQQEVANDICLTLRSEDGFAGWLELRCDVDYWVSGSAGTCCASLKNKHIVLWLC
jgi:hypothetical protein